MLVVRSNSILVSSVVSMNSTFFCIIPFHENFDARNFFCNNQLFPSVIRSLIANLSAANCYKSEHLKKPENWALGIIYIFSICFVFGKTISLVCWEDYVCLVWSSKVAQYWANFQKNTHCFNDHKISVEQQQVSHVLEYSSKWHS
jgi:hypothetical protein